MVIYLSNKLLLVPCFLVLMASSSLSQVSALFTTNPTVVNGTISVCQGSTILFTMGSQSQTNITSESIIEWTFTGASMTTSSSQGVLPVQFLSSGTAKLKVTDGAFSDSTSITINVSTPPFTPTLSLASGSLFSSTVLNGVSVFKNCSALSNSPLTLNYPSLSCATVSSIVINWGNATANTTITCPTFPSSVSKTYSAAGNYNLTFTVNFLNGCKYIGYYQVQIGNGQSNLSTSSSNFACSPGVFPLLFDAQFPGNTYTVAWGDDSTSVFAYPNLPTAPIAINHTYEASSCNASTPNGYSVVVTATNACGPSTNTPGQIFVSKAPTPNIITAPTTPTVCVGTSMTFFNSSDPGIYVSSNTVCTNDYKHYWLVSSNLIAPNTVSGSLGDYNTTGASSLSVNFNQAGTYTVSLVVYNLSCEPDTIEKTICVVGAVDAQFSMSSNSVCAPYTLVPVNTSSSPTCTIFNNYLWTITSTDSQGCGGSPSTSTNVSQSPSFTLSTPGVYSVKLKVSLSQALLGTQCANDSITQLITVKGKPIVALPTPSPICLGSPFTPLSSVVNCYATTAASYAWSFNPSNTIPSGSIPNPSSSTSQSTSTTYPASGTFPYSLTATNECGSTTANQSITVQPATLVNTGTYSSTCANTPVQLAGSVSGAVTTGTWTASVSGGIFSPNATTLNAVYTPPLNYSGTITLTLTSSTPPAPCIAVSASKSIVFNSQAIANTGSYPNGTCMNQALQLNGSVGGAASSGTWSANLSGGTFSPAASNLSASYTPPLNYTGDITLILTTNNPSGPCEAAISGVEIKVKELPQASILPVTSTSCSGNLSTHVISSSLDSTTYFWAANLPLPDGVTASNSGTISYPSNQFSTTITNDSTTIKTVTYSIIPISSGCYGTPITTQISVEPVAKVAALSNISVCPAESISPQVIVATPSSSTLAWAASSTSVGIGSSGNGQLPTWIAPANATGAALNSIITVTPTYNTCVGTPSSFTVTVKPTPSISTPSLAQAICSGQATTPVTWSTNPTGSSYQWSAMTSGASVSGFTSSGTGSFPSFSGITNTGNTPETITYTLIPTFSNCIGASTNYVITVQPTPVLTLSPSQTICSGTATVASSFSSTISNGSFSWVLSNAGSVPSTVTGYLSSGVGQLPSNTITNSGTAPFTLNYQVTPTANGCNGASLTYAITVNPAPTVQFSLPNQSICTGTTATQAVSLSTSVSGATFSWSANVPFGIGNVGVTTGTNSIPSYSNLTNSTTNSLQITITAIANTAGVMQCAGSPSTYTITVNPSPTVQAAFASNDTICSGSNASINLTSTTPNTTFTWSATNGAGISGGVSSSVGLAAIQQALTNSSNVIEKVTYVITPSASLCAGIPITVLVYVNPVVQVNNTANLAVCPGQVFSPAAFISNPFGASFTWTNSTTAIGLGASGVGSISSWLAPSNNSTNQLLSVITVTPSLNGCVGTATAFTATVYPIPSISNTVLAQSICSNSSTSAVLWTSAVSGTSYSWTATASSSNVTGYPTTGSSHLPALSGIINNGSTLETVTVTTIPTANGCTGLSKSYVFTIKPTPSLVLSPSQTICGGSSSAITAFSTNVSGGSYTWSLTNVGIPSTVTAYPTSGTGQLPATIINNTGTAPYTLVYTVTPVANGCAGTSSTYSITVNPAPATQFSLPNQQVCTGVNSTSAVTLSSPTSSVSFSWTASVPSGIGNFSPISGTSSIPSYSNLTNSSNLPLTVVITANATTSIGASCAGANATYSITVNPAPIAQAVFASNDTVCSNSDAQINLSSTTPNTLFSWVATNGTGVSGGANSTSPGTVIQQTLVNASTSVQSVSYVITPTASACSGAPITVTANVNPVATMGSLASITGCTGELLTPTAFTSIPSGSTFKWTTTNTGIGIVQNGVGTIVSWNAPANNSGVDVVGTISVTPTYNSCVGTASSFSVTIHPTPTVTTNPMQQTICEASPSAAVNFSSSLVGSTITWTQGAVGSDVSGYLTGSGTATLGAMTLSLNGVATQSVVYSVRAASIHNCLSPAVDYTLYVKPSPVIVPPGGQTICSGTSTSAVSFSSDIPGSSYSWNLTSSSPFYLSGFLTNGTGGLPSMALSNSEVTPQTLTYSVQPSFGNCYGVSQNYVVTVNPAPTVSFSSPNQAICTGQSTNAVNLTSSVSNATITWSANVPVGISGFTTTSGTTMIPSMALSNLTSSNLTATITALATSTGALGCSGVATTYSITVSPQAQITVSVADSSLCSGNSLQVAMSSNVSGTSFSWTPSSSANVTGASLGNGASFQQLLLNTGNTQGTVNYSISTVNASGNVCPTSYAQVSATVEAVANIQFSQPNQHICSGNPTDAVSLSSNVSAASIAWTASTINGYSGVTLSGTTNIPTQTITNSGILVGNIVYTAIATVNGCSGASSTYTIEVFPLPVATASPSDITLCSGTQSSILLSSTVSNTTYSWTPSVNYFISGSSGGTSANVQQTLHNISAQVQTVYYTAVPTSAGPTASGCTGNSVSFSITVNPAPSVTYNLPNQTICSGANSQEVSISSETIGAQISWTANIPAGITGAQSSGSTSIPIQSLVNTTYEPLTILYTTTITTSGGNCAGTPSSYSIVVNPTPTLSYSMGDQTICSGTSSSQVLLTSTISPAYSSQVYYAWTAVQPIGVTGVSPSGLATIPVQSISSTNVIPMTITYNSLIFFTYNGVSCAGNTVPYTITVNPIPTTTISVPITTICSGDVANLSFSSTVGNTTFSYTTSFSGAITGASGGTASTVSQTLINTSSSLDSVRYNVTGMANNCVGQTEYAVIYVKPSPIVSPIPAVSVCPGQSIGAFNFTSIPSGASYSWTNTSSDIGLAGSGTGNIASWTAPSNNSGGNAVGTISVVPVLNGCIGATGNFSITVKPTPVLTVSPLQSTICSGANAVISCTSNAASTQFNWVASMVNASGQQSGSSTVNQSTISQVVTNPSTNVGSVVYTITPVANSCVGIPVDATVTVNPIPAITLNPSSMAICSGETASIVVSGTIATSDYSWTVSPNAAISGTAAGTGNLISQALTNSSFTNQVVTYSVVPSLNGCTGLAVLASVTVKPTPNVLISPTAQTICSGASTAINLSSSVVGTTFSYTPTTVASVSGATVGNTSSISQQLTNSSNQAQTVIYTVNSSANNCVGSSNSVTVTVNPSVTVTSSVTSTAICSNEHAMIQLSSTTPNTVFNWTATPNTEVLGEADGTGSLIDQALVNTSNVVQLISYTITPQFNGCNGVPIVVLIIINPLPQITLPATSNACINSPAFDIIGYSPVGGTWSGLGITSVYNGTFNPSVAGLGPKALTYSYTDSSTGCSNTATQVVTVRPLPVPGFSADSLKCVGSSVTYTNTSTGGTSYFWDFKDGGTSLQTNATHSFSAVGNYPVSLTVTSAYGCKDSVVHAIHIITTPSTSFTVPTHSGCGPLSVPFTNTTTGATSYLWNFGYPTNGPFSSSAQPGTHVFPSPYLADSMYHVALTASNSCGFTTYYDSILVRATPKASFALNTNSGCSPITISFLNNSVGSPTNYVWNFGDGTFSTAAQAANHTYFTGTSDTTYSIALIAMNACGSDTSSELLHVLPNTVTAFFNTAPTIGCAPFSVQFTNYSLGATNYAWSFGDGQVSSTMNPTHVYLQSGQHTIQLIADNGCSIDTVSQTITVHPKPLVDFSIVEDTLCMNQVFSFTNTSEPLSNTAWLFGDGATSNVYNPTHLFNQSGSFTVTLIGTSNAYGCIDSIKHTVYVLPTPSLAYSSLNYIGCAAFEVSFTELSNTANFAVWNYMDGNTGIGLSSTHTYANAGTFHPTVIAQNIYGCVDTAVFNVYVKPKPLSAFQLSDSISCDYPFTVSTNNLSTGASAYSWDFGNSTTSVLNAPSVTYTSTGDYAVQLVATNQFSCSDTSVHWVHVFEKPKVSFLPSVKVGCEDLSVLFNNATLFADSYLWQFGTGSSSTATSPSYTYLNPGTYTVSLVASNANGCSDSVLFIDLITVHERPTANFTVNPTQISTEAPTIQLTNLASNYDSGFYAFGDGKTEDVSAIHYDYGVADSGLYLISQVVSTVFGCKDTAYATIHLEMVPTYYIPNTFTPDGDGMNETWMPAGMAVKYVDVTVFNRWGEIVFSAKEAHPAWDGNDLNGKACQDGVYSYRIVGRDINNRLLDFKGNVNLIR